MLICILNVFVWLIKFCIFQSRSSLNSSSEAEDLDDSVLLSVEEFEFCFWVFGSIETLTFSAKKLLLRGISLDSMGGGFSSLCYD